MPVTDENKADFMLFPLEEVKQFKTFDEQFSSVISAWNSNDLKLESGTHFGYVYEGTIDLLINDNRQYTLEKGMYFSVNSAAKIISRQKPAKGFIISRNEYNGFFSIGGPVEQKGRYKYIDGCSDSLLISPVLKGDPCLNLLYFPSKIFQTRHTHPSVRIGIILQGSGQCILPDMVLPLTSGQIFIIQPDVIHSFKTDTSDMTIVVYHPDSDFGPTDQNHPMINKTIINGVSASLLTNF
jgi:quercetin dioxygenase-like cupin family protein